MKKLVAKPRTVRVARKPIPAPRKLAVQIASDAALEREADDAAARATRGELNIARRLSTIGPSHFALPGSAGEPLPRGVRTRLEAAFGHDFGGVRVHRDGAAQRAASAFGAAAFTAGRDIYFAARHFEPASRAGFSLLAHEVAHVVQQSSSTLGGRGIQRDELKGVDLVASLEESHRKTWGRSNTALEDTILIVELELGTTTEAGKTSMGGDALAWRAREGKYNKDPAGASFLLDVLKKLGGDNGSYLEDAAQILERDTKLEIKCLPSARMAEHLDGTRTDDAWFDLAYEHELVKPWFDDLYNTFRVLVFNPFSDGAPMWANGKTLAQHFDATKVAVMLPPFTSNDRVSAALSKLMAFEIARLDEIRRWTADAKVATDSVAGQRRYIAKRLETWANDARSLVVARPIWDKLYEKLWILGREAQVLWGAPATDKVPVTGAMAHLALYGDRVGNLAKPHELASDAIIARRGGLKTTTELMELEKLLTDASKLIFEIGEDGALPSPSIYSTRVEQLRVALVGEPKGMGGMIGKLTGIAGRLGQRLAESPLGPELAKDEFAMMGFIIGWITMTSARWPVYNAAFDSPRFEDGRHYHRHLMAGMLLRIAIFANFQALEKQTSDVLNGLDVSRSYVALNGNWEHTAASVERMMLDFKPSDTPLREGDLILALEVRSIVEFFKLAKLRAANAALERILEGLESTAVTRHTKVDLSSVDRAIRAVPRPKRYVAKGFHIIRRPEDRGKIELWRLLAENKKTEAQLVPRHLVIIPKEVPFEELGELAAWILPDLTPLATELQAIPALAVLKTSAKTPIEWLVEISEIAQDPLKDIEGRIFGGLSDAKRGTAFERDRKTTLLRKITAYRRRSAILAIDAEHAVFAGNPKSDSIPNVDRALRAAYKFLGDVEPFADTEIQRDALMLAIAPGMEKAFTASESAKQQIAPEWFVFIYGAIALSTTEDRAERLRAILFDGDASAETLLANLDAVERVKALLDAAIAENQEQFGFKSDGRAIQALKMKVTELGTQVKVGESFEFDGITYTLHYLNPRPFVYHPAMPAVAGSKSVLLVDGKEVDRASTKLFEISVVDEDGALPDPVRGERLTRNDDESGLSQEEKDALLERRLESPYFTVMGNHDQMLTHLSGVVFWRTLTTGLDRIATGLEVVGAVAMAFVPGGAAVATITIGTSVIQLANDPEMQDLIHKVSTDPAQIVTMFATRLDSMFELENVWDFLLFSSSHPAFAKLTEVMAKERGGVQAKPRGKLGKLVRFITEFGKRMLRVFRRLRLAFRSPVAGLHSTFITHPMLSWLLERGLALIEDGQDLYEQGAKLAASGDGLARELGELMGTFAELELPDELIPTEGIVEMFLSFVIGKIPYARIARPILDETGATAAIAKWLTEDLKLKENILNPNNLYRDNVLEPFGKKVTEARDGFATELYQVLNEVLAALGESKFEVPAFGTLQIPTVPTTEMQASPSTDRRADGKPLAVPGDGGGQRLGRAAAMRAARTFRQDFRHVRLHQDAVADRFTSSAGADAITSGSHIFLRTTIPSDSPVLAHELAHVVQQTGQRPLDRSHPDTPVRGRSGGPLTWDRQAEVEAERAANDASGNRVVVVGTSFDAAQPKFSDVLRKIAKRMTHVGAESEFEESFVDGEMQDPDRYKSVWKSIMTVLKQSGTFAKFLSTDEIKKTILADLDGLQADTFAKVAKLAQDPVKVAKGKKPQTKLDVREFVRALEGYVMAKAGITMHVELTRGDKPSVKSVEITYVFLPRVDTKSLLWTKALEDSVYSDTERLLPKTPKPDDVTKTRALVKGRLDAIGAKPFVWDDAQYRLSKRFVTSFEASKDFALDAQSFIDPTGKNSQDGFGLRIGTHGDLTTRKRMGRHSHHTTQFVLLELLRSRHTIRMFPNLDDDTAKEIGLETKSGLVTKAAGMNFEKLDPNGNRGDGMPAVMLAPDTHLRGGLHIDSQVDEAETSASQSEQVAKTYFAALPGPLNVRPVNTATWTTAIKSSPKDTIKKGIFSAVNQTYEWMYGVMRKPLLGALKTHERPYYERLVNVDPAKPEKLTLADTQLEQVVAAAHKNNTTLFKKVGFKDLA